MNERSDNQLGVREHVVDSVEYLLSLFLWCALQNALSIGILPKHHKKRAASLVSGVYVMETVLSSVNLDQTKTVV